VSLVSPLLVRHPQRLLSVDATAMGFTPDAVDRLPWGRVFAEMEALEAGALANADEGRQVGHYWLRAPELAPSVGQAREIHETLDGVLALAEDVRSGAVRSEDGLPYTDVLHLGIGGSALGPQLLVDGLQDGTGLRVHFLDNTDPDGIERVLRSIGDRLRHTLVVVVSKSGETWETTNTMHLVIDRLVERGLGAHGRFVAITGTDSELDRRARADGWLHRFPLWDWVGGRTSVTSSVGLLPAAFAGVQIPAFLAGAREIDSWTRTWSWRDNPAALLAASWYLAGNGKGDRHLVVLPYADRLLLLSRYLQQLVMESLGKRHDRQGNVVHQGLTVLGNKGSTDQHAFVQQLRDGRNDFSVSFVQVLSDGIGSGANVSPGANAGDYLQGFLLGTRRALSAEGRPSLVLSIPTADARGFGRLVAVFERAVGFYGSLVDVNAYDQPGVEAGKKAASKVLDLSGAVRAVLTDEPADAAVLAARLGADPVEVFHLLERLVETGRAVREGEAYARGR
jgi:glucose-6-phosphate isomerase